MAKSTNSETKNYLGLQNIVPWCNVSIGRQKNYFRRYWSNCTSWFDGITWHGPQRSTIWVRHYWFNNNIWNIFNILWFIPWIAYFHEKRKKKHLSFWKNKKYIPVPLWSLTKHYNVYACNLVLLFVIDCYKDCYNMRIFEFLKYNLIWSEINSFFIFSSSMGCHVWLMSYTTLFFLTDQCLKFIIF